MENFIIDTEDKLKDKQELIQKLVGINAANDAIKAKQGAVVTGTKPNPIDLNYERLDSKMSPILSDSNEYKVIQKYIENGSGGMKLEMVDCFSIERDGEAASYNPKKFGNKQLLWHGSRFSNYVGIITQGLKIAPPEAPHTGYVHGKGIYFANEIGLSWSYGCPGLSNGVGIYILAEVALGNMGPSIGSSANEKNRLEAGFNSTHVDRARPDPSDFTNVFGDVLVPYGKYLNGY